MYKKHILKSIEYLLKHQISKNRNNFGTRCNEVIYSKIHEKIYITITYE